MPKRFLAALVTLPLVLGVTAISPVGAQTGVGPCDLTRRAGESVGHFMKRRISCAVDTFGPVRGGAARAICIAKRESGLDPTASSATGKYLGLYQHSAKYWPNRYDAWTDPHWQLSDDALSGRTNAVVTVRMVHAAGGWAAAGWRVKAC